jgi:hypothetical protein
VAAEGPLGYDWVMRFRIRIELWMEVQSLADAQAATSRAERAAHEALGSAAVRDAATNALWRGDLTPIDRSALEGLAADDLGPGISSAGFTAPMPAESDET